MLARAHAGDSRVAQVVERVLDGLPLWVEDRLAGRYGDGDSIQSTGGLLGRISSGGTGGRRRLAAAAGDANGPNEGTPDAQGKIHRR